MNGFLDQILAPLCRLLVARGILFGAAAERLKQSYVQAAQARAGGRATDSRLSVMTGLQRRDVQRLRDGVTPPVPTDHALSRLVAQWQADPRYAGADLPRRGDEVSFDALAQSVRRDVHPRTLLDELLAAGTVTVLPGDLIRLLRGAHVPLSGSAAQLAYLGDNGGDFLAAAVGNILADTPRFFERALHYNHLSAGAVQQLEAQFRAEHMSLLMRMNTEARHLQATDPGTLRFKAGGYFYFQEDE